MLDRRPHRRGGPVASHRRPNGPACRTHGRRVSSERRGRAYADPADTVPLGSLGPPVAWYTSRTSTAGGREDTVMVMVTGKRPVVPEIDPQQAWERASRGDAVIVDVREPDEVAEVAVPGALVIPLGKLDEEVETIPSDREVLFLCRSGNRSAYATDFYRQRGHERTAISRAASLPGPRRISRRRAAGDEPQYLTLGAA